MRGASGGEDGGRKVKEGGNGNKISGTRAIDERERDRERETEHRGKEQVNSGGAGASAERR